MSPRVVAIPNPSGATNVTIRFYTLSLLSLTGSVAAQAGTFFYPANGRLTVDRSYHYRAECKVGNIEAMVVDEYVVNPPARVANVPITSTGGAASTQWGLVPTAYLPFDPIGCVAGVLEVLASRQGSTRIKADRGNIRFTFGDESLDLLRVDEDATCGGGPLDPVLVATSKMNSWNSILSTVPFTVRQQSELRSEFLSITLDVSDSPFSGLAEFLVAAQARLTVWQDVNLNGVFDQGVDQVVLAQATASLSGDQGSFFGPQSDIQPPQSSTLSPGRYFAVFEVDHMFDTKLVGNVAGQDDKFDTLGDGCTAGAHLTIQALSTGGTAPTGGGGVLGN